MSKILYDTHIHSRYSTDSDAPLCKQVEQAVSLGLHGICLTDHMDYEYPEEYNEDGEGVPFVFPIENYLEELQQLKDKYPMVEVSTGVECGMQTTKSVLKKNEELAQKYPWDYIIGSLHLVKKQDPYFPAFWENRAASDGVRLYFEQVYENILAFREFDSLGHLDYIVRYAPNTFTYQPETYFDIVDEILRFLIREDKALEINTSGLKSPAGTQNPHLEILKRYVSLGGELVTVGSDAHKPEYLAFSFEKAAELMKQAGLKSYVTYRQHKPVFHSL